MHTGGGIIVIVRISRSDVVSRLNVIYNLQIERHSTCVLNKSISSEALQLTHNRGIVVITVIIADIIRIIRIIRIIIIIICCCECFEGFDKFVIGCL